MTEGIVADDREIYEKQGFGNRVGFGDPVLDPDSRLAGPPGRG